MSLYLVSSVQKVFFFVCFNRENLNHDGQNKDTWLFHFTVSEFFFFVFSIHFKHTNSHIQMSHSLGMSQKQTKGVNQKKIQLNASGYQGDDDRE